MRDEHGHDAPCGQFGPTGFDAEDGILQHARVQISGAYLEPLAEPQVLVPASSSNDFPEPAVRTHERPSLRYRRQVEGLVEAHADLQPWAPFLSPFAHVSEFIQGASHRRDPIQGCLISSGDIRSEAHHRQISVVAVAVGECRSELLIFRMVTQMHTWNDSRIPIPGLPAKQAEEGRWVGGEGPIQQIKFRQRNDRKTPLLAVRLLRATKIFRPVQEESLQIRPNLLHTITIDQTGGQEHSDITFNPWFDQQLALVDQAGHWSILEFDTRKFKKIVRVWKGSASRMHPTLLYDGWARITWITSLTLLAVCSRRSLSLLDISNTEPTITRALDITSDSATDSFNEMVAVPLANRMDLLGLLTSTDIQICRVIKNPSEGPTLHSIFRIRHFHNPADLSLGVHFSCGPEYNAATLYSRAYHYVSCYLFYVTETDHVRYFDPMYLKLPRCISMSQSWPRISDVRLHCVEPTATSADPEQCDSTVYSPGFLQRLYVLDVLLTSGIVYSCLYRAVHEETTELLQTPHTTKNTPRSLRRVRHTRDSFVTTDDEHNPGTGQTFRSEPLSRRARRPRSLIKRPERAHQFDSIVNKIQTGATASVDLNLTLSQLRKVLEEPVGTDIPSLQSLSARLDAETTFHDVGEADAQLHDVINFSGESANHTDVFDSQVEQPRRVTVDSIPLASLMEHDFPCDSANLSTVYDTVISTWINPLSESIPIRARLAKEQLARRVASDVVLAQHSTRFHPVVETPISPGPRAEDDIPTLTWDLPVRTGEFRKLPASQDSLLPPTSSLPTPSPTATPSITTASGALSAFGDVETSRLSQYTTFSKPAPLPLPRNLDRILSHWTDGEDPERYDWLSTAITQRGEEAEESMTDSERQRAQRRAQRHILRQRKEAAASQAQQLASSQAFEVVSASQPSFTRVQSKPPEMGIPSSSQTIDPFSIGASQVVPGRFGGRPPPKKKKRKLGF